jgi:hypothetical protein
MNLILGNFDELARFIHPVEVRGARTAANDQVLQQLGLGVALAMQSACRRMFARLVDDRLVTTSHGTILLPRYPVEDVTLVETRANYEDAWVGASSAVEDLDEASGVLKLNVTGRVRITYTGGYWTETLEPDEPGYPSTMPTAAKPVPEDLKTAWLLATQHVWEHKDHWIPKTLGGNGTVSPLSLADLGDHLPVVAQAITDYRRITL